MTVSILMPVRDAQDTLGACLATIKAQTLRTFELIAVDDASSDDSRPILRAAAKRDSRIRVIENSNPGLVNALNFGLSACNFDLVARMDADDLMHPQRLQRQWETFADSANLTVLGTRVEIIAHADTAHGLREYVRWQNQCLTPREIVDNIYVESPFAHPSVMFRKNIVTAVGGYRGGAFPEDYDLWLRLARAGHMMQKLPETLVQWRDGPRRVSRTDPRCTREAFDRLRAGYLATDPRVLGATDGVCFWGAGRRTRRRVAHLQRRGVRARAWIDIDPRKIGNIIDGARVLAPAALDSLADPFVLSYVANHGAREAICACLNALGLQLGRNYLCVG